MNKEELQKKYAGLLAEKGSLLVTEDGQVFYNDEKGKKFAESHAVGKRLAIVELKAAKKEAPKKAAAKKSTNKDK